MGLLDDLELLKKRKPNLLANVQQLQRPAEPYLRQQYPEVYGGLGGLLGMAPDEMAGSILDPNTARVRAGAQIGFPVGTAAQVLPALNQLAPAVKAGARALGPTAVSMGEGYLKRRGLMPELDVYHGSPHKFDRFDASKIGTGEGAQAYGHGLYTAESPDTAKYYQLLALHELKADPYNASVINRFMGKSATPIDNGGESLGAYALADASKAPFVYDPVLAMKNLRDKARESRIPNPWLDALGINPTDPAINKANFDAARKYIRDFSRKTDGTGAISHLYKVDLPDEQIAKMLDWDKPMSDQPKIMKALTPENMGLTLRQPTDGGFMAYVGINGKPIGIQVKGGTPEAFRQKWIDRLTEFGNAEGGAGRAVGYLGGTSTSGELAPAVSSALRQAGIPGIKYLDEGSRAAGTGTRNFVTFPGEEQSMTILERNGQPMIARPQQQDAAPDLLQYQQMQDEEERKKLGGLLFR